MTVAIKVNYWILVIQTWSRAGKVVTIHFAVERDVTLKLRAAHTVYMIFSIYFWYTLPHLFVCLLSKCPTHLRIHFYISFHAVFTFFVSVLLSGTSCFLRSFANIFGIMYFLFRYFYDLFIVMILILSNTLQILGWIRVAPSSRNRLTCRLHQPVLGCVANLV